MVVVSNVFCNSLLSPSSWSSSLSLYPLLCSRRLRREQRFNQDFIGRRSFDPGRKCLLGFSISNAAAAQSPAGGSFFACFIKAFQQHYFFPSFTLSMSSSRTSKVKEENWEIARGNLVYDPIDFRNHKKVGPKVSASL